HVGLIHTCASYRQPAEPRLRWTRWTWLGNRPQATCVLSESSDAGKHRTSRCELAGMAAPILCWRDTRRFEFSRILSNWPSKFYILTRRSTALHRARGADDTNAFRQRAPAGRIRTLKSHKRSTSNFARKSCPSSRALAQQCIACGCPRTYGEMQHGRENVETRNSLEMRTVSLCRRPNVLHGADVIVMIRRTMGVWHSVDTTCPSVRSRPSRVRRCEHLWVRRPHNMIKPSTEHLLPRPSRPPVIRISSHTPCQPWIRYAECRRILPRLRERGERSNPPTGPAFKLFKWFGFGPARACVRPGFGLPRRWHVRFAHGG
ncbi:hypothetical protein LXA43DRAFT_1035993, partial [Ganoderma leucocontextum]